MSESSKQGKDPPPRGLDSFTYNEWNGIKYVSNGRCCLCSCVSVRIDSLACMSTLSLSFCSQYQHDLDSGKDCERTKRNESLTRSEHMMLSIACSFNVNLCVFVKFVGNLTWNLRMELKWCHTPEMLHLKTQIQCTSKTRIVTCFFCPNECTIVKGFEPKSVQL